MSDLPEGYKMSEVGVIPEEWEVKTLGEKTTKIGSGITPTGGEKVYKSEGRPFLRSQNVGWGNLILEDIAFIDDEIHNTFKATEIEKNDVFLNITGASIGRSAIADERVQNGNVNQHVCIIRTIEDGLNPKFLNYFLLSKKGQKQIDSFQAGGNRQGLNFGQIKSFQIPLPPLPEQQAIASALSDVDALITALEQLITKKRNIKQGAMQQLLTGKKRLPGFGGAWEVKKLGEIGKLKNGINKGKEDFGFGYSFVNLLDVFGRRKLTQFSSLGLVNSSIVEREIYDLRKGDVLFIRSSVKPAGVGLTSVVNNDLKDTVYSGFLIRFRDFGKMYLEYKVHCFNEEGFRKKVMDSSTVSANTNINQDALKNLQIKLPPTIEEQQAIAKILSDMDTEMESLEQKRNKYKAIKQGMMQELLTGKRRLA